MRKTKEATRKMPIKKSTENKGLVYSTEFGTMCPACHNPTAHCSCRKNHALPINDGIVRLRRETKGRKGKGVTLITGLPLAGDDLKKRAKALKQMCGSGGGVKNGVIEIQGDHRDVLEKELKRLGHKVKRAGG
ncbi:MAG: translation initiation factor Sui1 [Desulfurivibrionaceae bacterium]|nr:translation initiation factor Sui1 [Desulfurivibrionaceae bacterium]